jgi:hypothetical protein
MAQEIRQFQVTTPAGRLITNPLVTDLTMPARRVESIRIRIPPGPSGQLGFALGSAGQRVIPWNANGWFVGDDEIINLPLADQIDSGAWQLQSYNTGSQPHTLLVTFYLNTIQDAAAAAMPLPLDITP